MTHIFEYKRTPDSSEVDKNNSKSKWQNDASQDRNDQNEVLFKDTKRIKSILYW